MDTPTARDTARSARDERSVVAIPSERRLTPRSDRGFASRSTGSADRVRHHAVGMATKTRATKRVFCGGRLTRRPRFTPSRGRRWDSDASSKAARRRERTTLQLGHIDAGPSSWRAGRLTPPPWEQRMRAAEDGGCLFGASAQCAQDRQKKDARTLPASSTAEAAEALANFPQVHSGF